MLCCDLEITRFRAMSGIGIMNSLNQKDIQSLHSSFIVERMVEEAKLRRVDDIEGADIVGRRRCAGKDFGGLVFPYFIPPDYANTREYRLRRDVPDCAQKADGSLKEEGKYLSPPGRGNMIYFPPGVTEYMLSDVSLPIVITEGEKKTLALYRLATEDLTLDHWHFLPIGIAGVWNFRTNTGKIDAKDGSRRQVKGFLPDFALIRLGDDRSASILYDANVETNASVAAARTCLARELNERGAKAGVIDIPEQPAEAQINGIDDLLGYWEEQYGIDEALRMGLELIESKAITADDSDDGGTQSARMVRLVENAGATFFHDAGGEAFISIPVQSHVENHRIDSKFFRSWISNQFWKSEGKVPSTKAIQDATNAMCGKARFDSPQENVFVRLAELNGRIYLDLANDNWDVIEISSDGWKVIESLDCPVKFRHPNTLLPLPTPIRGEKLDTLYDFINVSEQHFLLVVVWILACLRTDRPFPVLILNGEQGSAKSTTSKVLRRLIDPNLAELRPAPSSLQDLMIAANNGWILTFDNLSTMPDWLSDAFCRLSTGGGFATRTLYQNDEETIFSAMRPILLNGITELATRSDLLDRALLIDCPTIPKLRRRDEESFWREFDLCRPALLGALLDAMSAALRELPNVTLFEAERMADFERFGVAVERGLGLEPGIFQRTYSANRRVAHDVAVEGSITPQVVTSFMEGRDDWSGTATKLLAVLRQHADQNSNLGFRAEDLPKKPNRLSGELKRVAPNLRSQGIEFQKSKSGSRTVSLRRIPVVSSESSESSKPVILSPLNCSELDDCDSLDDSRDAPSSDIYGSKTKLSNSLDDLDDSDDGPKQHYAPIEVKTETIFPNDAVTFANHTNQRIDGYAAGRAYVRCRCGKHTYTDNRCPHCNRDPSLEPNFADAKKDTGSLLTAIGGRTYPK